ncbi:uncharacterized protein LY79DRAFT_556599 [Colletotrichum navitas]|uniref:Uncharacterized protein n=1 Tax=Colletotrichum navitas TaxID=681940 RepID=A0AAD8PY12_9PEZI|nr:uncharacterized protein LY79DRAFT_556599 [Colletotrichum navitas]KAK1589644.1 hypothetical protein LY79DRAFT_556599 [Colletotrichum navitas]
MQSSLNKPKYVSTHGKTGCWKLRTRLNSRSSSLPNYHLAPSGKSLKLGSPVSLHSLFACAPKSNTPLTHKPTRVFIPARHSSLVRSKMGYLGQRALWTTAGIASAFQSELSQHLAHQAVPSLGAFQDCPKQPREKDHWLSGRQTLALPFYNHSPDSALNHN